MNNFVVAIVGPTACGKTEFSIELARQFKGQVVCCDSRTVYRYMDIGTAKPSHAQRKVVPHHMLDIIEPDCNYTAAQYTKDARIAIDTILSDGSLPIICGGAGLYFKAALEDLKIPQVPPNTELRKKLNDLANHKGNAALHARLAQIDPSSAYRIHVNDRFRVVRALEVSLTTGVPFSKSARTQPSQYDVIWIGLSVIDRPFLQARILSRLQAQMESGLLEEVRSLYDRFGECETLMNTINYSEFIPCLSGNLTEAKATEICLKNNYQLARRQIMWFKRNKNINWFFIDKQEPEAVQSDAAKFISAKLNGKVLKADLNFLI